MTWIVDHGGTPEAPYALPVGHAAAIRRATHDYEGRVTAFFDG